MLGKLCRGWESCLRLALHIEGVKGHWIVGLLKEDGNDGYIERCKCGMLRRSCSEFSLE